jgi:TolA-binding protein
VCQKSVGTQGEQHQQQRFRTNILRIEERDDANGDQIINDGECQEENPQRARQVRTDQGQNSDGEGDVRRCRDRPPPQRFGTGKVDHSVNDGGNSDPTGGSGNRHNRLTGLAQVPDQELPPKFKADVLVGAAA